MTLKIGDDVLILESSASATGAYPAGRIIQVTGDNQTDLTSMVLGGVARVLQSGLAALYVAILSQSGTSAPSATIRENTLSGVPVLARTAEGTGTITLTGVFTQNKTIATLDIVARSVSDEFKADVTWTSANVLTYHVRDNSGALIDGFAGVLIIKVYS